MNKENITNEIEDILVNVLKHHDFTLTDELSAKDVEGWDSLTHMIIITEIEKKFDLKFKLKELNKLSNLKNLIDLINVKLQTS